MTIIQKSIDTTTTIHDHIILHQEVLHLHVQVLDHQEDLRMVIIVQDLLPLIHIILDVHLLLQVVVVVEVQAEEILMIIDLTIVHQTTHLILLTIEVVVAEVLQVVPILLILQEDTMVDLRFLPQTVVAVMEHLLVTAVESLQLVHLYNNIIKVHPSKDHFIQHPLLQHLIHPDNHLISTIHH